MNRLKTAGPAWLVSTVIMAGLLYGTSPDEIGPLGVTAFFVVGYISVALTLQVIVLTVVRLLSRPGRLKEWRFLYSVAAAFLPVAAVGLNSLDQLILRDVILFVALIALVIFYLVARTEKQT